MKYSQFRVSIVTFALGVLCVPFANGLYEKWSEPYVEVPQVVAELPIIIGVCPEPPTEEEAKKFYREHGYDLIRQSSSINCNQNGGGGGSGVEEVEEIIVVTKAKSKKENIKSCWR